jgi:2-haloacid dehalogenase
MTIDRRRFLDLAAAGVVASALGPAIRAAEAGRARFEAVAFDAFPVFDPRPIADLTEALFPGKGVELGGAWRNRQFEYQWLRALGGRYEDFLRTTEDALVFAAAQLRLDLSAETKDRLMQAYLDLKAWPDAPPALASLKSAGVRLAFLSNMTVKMLEDGIRNAKLGGLFEHVLSTDRIRSYKPDPRAYRMAIDAFGLEREQILFVSFAGWDAAGAKWFGYPTFWNNRLGLPPEELGAAADATGKDLSALTGFISSTARGAPQGDSR